jgi:hypothetical protein
MSRALMKRRQVRLQQAHDEILESMSRQRGCDVVDLFREAIIAHFNLPTGANSTDEKQIHTSNDAA